jgi:uncharacterized damage-inducible protein DinB
MSKPQNDDYAPYYQTYVGKVEGETIAELIGKYSTHFNEFINSLPEAKANYAYAEGKWNVKQVLQHIIDTERVFGYRALCFARKDATHLSSFGQDEYVANDNTNERSLQSLKDEFVAVRKSTDMMLSSFNETQLQQIGTASNNKITVNALAFIIFGHVIHHLQLFQEKYL